jgi:hemerythrin
MQKIAWTKKLSVGVDLIDDQHKALIRHLNDLVTAVEAREGATRVVSTLQFLIEYTDFHFSTEEKKMDETRYPGMESHKSRHEELRKNLANLVVDFSEKGATNELAGSIVTFLGNWLALHIESVDIPFGQFLREQAGNS